MVTFYGSLNVYTFFYSPGIASINTISLFSFSFSAKLITKETFVNLLNLNRSNSNKILEGRKSRNFVNFLHDTCLEHMLSEKPVGLSLPIINSRQEMCNDVRSPGSFQPRLHLRVSLDSGPSYRDTFSNRSVFKSIHFGLHIQMHAFS